MLFFFFFGIGFVFFGFVRFGWDLDCFFCCSKWDVNGVNGKLGNFVGFLYIVGGIFNVVGEVIVGDRGEDGVVVVIFFFIFYSNFFCCVGGFFCCVWEFCRIFWFFVGIVDVLFIVMKKMVWILIGFNGFEKDEICFRGKERWCLLGKEKEK